ncbi:hypothetical protein AP058_00068 [Flavobacterium sp. TAB 87]|nr:hypothetical protein AP058_00068 [Flavobacterium sp. TAB 87]
MARFSPSKPTTVLFGNLTYVIPELNTENLPLNNNYTVSYTPENEKILY